MKNLLSIELDKQIYLPGEDVAGKVILNFEKHMKVSNIYVHLDAMETAGAKNFWYLFTVPTLEDKRVLYATKEEKEDIRIKEGEYSFSFTLPAQSPPSFKSADFACEYVITVKVDLGLGKILSTRSHITVSPNILRLPKNAEIEFGISNDTVLFRCFLEKEYFAIGEPVKGNYYLEYPTDNKLKEILFELEAVGECLDKNFPFQEKIWSGAKKAGIKPHAAQSLSDNFFFDVPNIAPPSGLWNTFRVSWVINAKVHLDDGSFFAARAYFNMYKFYGKFWDEKSVLVKKMV